MSSLIAILLTCWNDRHLYRRLQKRQLAVPNNLYQIWGREPCAYVAAAILAVNTRGE